MPDFISCDNNNMTAEQLIAALITKTADGEWAIRTMQVEACELDAIDCNAKALPPFEALKKCIGINDCGKPALRLALPTLA